MAARGFQRCAHAASKHLLPTRPLSDAPALDLQSAGPTQCQETRRLKADGLVAADVPALLLAAGLRKIMLNRHLCNFF